MRLASLAAVLVSVSLPAAAQVSPGEGEPASETRPRREGFAVGVGLGPSILVGFRRSDQQVAGVGGALNVRFGTVATERLMWFVELEAAAYQIPGEDEKTLSRQQNTLTLGGHYFVREIFWVGFGLGAASFRSAETRTSDDGSEILESEENLSGLASRYTAGVDLFRSGIFALAAEAGVAIGVYDGEGLSNLTLRLSGSWH